MLKGEQENKRVNLCLYVCTLEIILLMLAKLAFMFQSLDIKGIQHYKQMKIKVETTLAKIIWGFIVFIPFNVSYDFH